MHTQAPMFEQAIARPRHLESSSLNISMRNEGSTICFLFHSAANSGPENSLALPLPALSPGGSLELGLAHLSPLGVFLLSGSPPFWLPCSLLLLPGRISVPLARLQEPYGIFRDSQGVVSLHPHPSSSSGLSRDHCLFTPGRVLLLVSSQVSQWALIEPWKPHQLSQGLSKTSSVCPLLSQAIKVWSCLPEL